MIEFRVKIPSENTGTRMRSPEHKEAIFRKIVTFLSEIGIKVDFVKVPNNSFLPGIEIENGALLIDKNSLKYPGDLLHEAGHLAVTPADQRKGLNGEKISEDEDNMGSEIAAILWSYAALVHLDLEPDVVFHENGYRGNSEWFIENFTSGNYIGLPLLQWMGLCGDGRIAGTDPFPAMLKWLKD